ncbi:hypothetical protein UF06_22235, partial [Vibrio sp. S234-5]
MAIKRILFASLLATSVSANGAENVVVQDSEYEAAECEVYKGEKRKKVGRNATRSINWSPPPKACNPT